MKLIKTAVAAALATLAFSASAMTQIADEQLSAVSGQDGVSIAANLNINMDSFTYTDTDAGTGGSVSFNKIHVGGLIAASIDIISHAKFDAILGAVGVDLNKTGLATASVPSGTDMGKAFYNGATDVVQIAVPNVTTSHGIDMSVGSITMGGNSGTAPSFGSMAINNLDLRGTTVWIWAH
jgi:hypothetical protein